MLDMDVKLTHGEFELDAAFSAPSGIIALYGVSGAGKTTLAKVLAGLETPSSGHVHSNDKALFDSTKGINVPAHRRKIGYVFQEHRLFPHYSVRGNLNYGKARSSRKGSSVTFKAVVDLLGIKSLLDRKPQSLSLGEQQRVAIGRALLSNPRILIMDEPLSSLDAARKQDILPLIEKLKTEFDLTILYISHSLSEIIQIADSIVLIDDGKVKGFGPVSDILSRLDLLPFTGGFDAGSVVSARVTRHDLNYKISELETAGGPILIPGMGYDIGRHIRVHIRARDVALASEEPKNLSILNKFKGVITDHRSGQTGMEELLIDVGFPLTARITRKSFEALQLRTGAEVWALIKSVTIEASELDIPAL